MSTGYNIPWFLLNFGPSCANGFLYTYVADSDQVNKPTYSDYSLTTARANPIRLDGNGIAPETFFESGGYYFIVRDVAGNEMYSRDNVFPGSGGGVSVDDHMVSLDAADVAGYLLAKFISTPSVTAQEVPGSSPRAMGGYVNESWLLKWLNQNNFGKVQSDWSVIDETSYAFILNKPDIFQVSVDGTDAGGHLSSKVGSADESIILAVANGKLDFAVDYTKISANLTNLDYAVWFSDSTGKLSGSSNLTYGDPNHGGNGVLYSQNFLAGSNFVIFGSGFSSFYDGGLDLQFSTNGARVKLAVQDRIGNVYGTAFISAHNSANTASIVTDRASFSNLNDGRLVFSAKLAGEDLIYLHTADGLSFNPSTNILSIPSIATSTLTISSLTNPGLLANDGQGNISSIAMSQFTSDHKSMISADDTAPSYIGDKIAAGNNVSISITNDAQNGQRCWISARSNMLLTPTYISANYTVTDTDTCIVNYASESITLTMPAPAMTYNGRGIEIFNASPEIMYVVGGITFSAMMNFGMRFRCVRDYTQTWVWIQVTG